MNKTEIIELMPDIDTWPEWAQEAMSEGRLFGECMARIEKAEKLEAALKKERGIIKNDIDIANEDRTRGVWLTEHGALSAVDWVLSLMSRNRRQP